MEFYPTMMTKPENVRRVYTWVIYLFIYLFVHSLINEVIHSFIFINLSFISAIFLYQLVTLRI